MPKIKYQTSLKVQALTRLLQDNEPISSICEDLKISPLFSGNDAGRSSEVFPLSLTNP